MQVCLRSKKRVLKFEFKFVGQTFEINEIFRRLQFLTFDIHEIVLRNVKKTQPTFGDLILSLSQFLLLFKNDTSHKSWSK